MFKEVGCDSHAVPQPFSRKTSNLFLEQDMNKYKKLLIFVGLLVFLGSGFVYFRQKSEPTKTLGQQISVVQTASLTVDFGTERKDFDITEYIGKTALDATAGIFDKNIKTQGSDTNAFITAIDGHGTDSKKHEFWELVINDKVAEVGAGSYVIQKGDKIKWRIDTY